MIKKIKKGPEKEIIVTWCRAFTMILPMGANITTVIFIYRIGSMILQVNTTISYKKKRRKRT
jgi:hypothetical protein